MSLKIIGVFVYALVCKCLCTKPWMQTMPAVNALLEHFMADVFLLKEKTNLH